MQVKRKAGDSAPDEDTEVIQYGERVFSAAEIAEWKKIAKDADKYWLEFGSDPTLDEEFHRLFNVTVFQHAHLSKLFGNWTTLR